MAQEEAAAEAYEKEQAAAAAKLKAWEAAQEEKEEREDAYAALAAKHWSLPTQGSAWKLMQRRQQAMREARRAAARRDTA